MRHRITKKVNIMSNLITPRAPAVDNKPIMADSKSIIPSIGNGTPVFDKVPTSEPNTAALAKVQLSNAAKNTFSVPLTESLMDNERIPSSWDVQPSGDTLTATHNVTRRVFEGTPKEFSAFLRS